jgi:hypothetical protein
MPPDPQVLHRIGGKLDSHRDGAIGALAARQHGVVSRRQLLDAGLSSRAVERRLESGRLLRLHRGVYAVGHRAVTRDAACMAATLVAANAVLSHRSAAALWGIRPTERERIEISVPRSLKPRQGLQIHQARLPPDETDTHRGIRVTTPARTLLDLAAVLDATRLERATTEAEIRRLTSPTSLDALVARYPNRHGTAAIKALLHQNRIASAVTKHELELRFLAFLDEARLPRPQINATIALPDKPRTVDCLWPGQRLVAELDGFATHGTRHAFEEDRARDRALQVAGYRTVRITWRQLTEGPSTVANDLRTLLGRPPRAG